MLLHEATDEKDLVVIDSPKRLAKRKIGDPSCALAE